MYLNDIGRLSNLSNVFGAKRVNTILQGNLILSRKGFIAKATKLCCCLCLPCFTCQGSKQFASLFVCKGRSIEIFFSPISDFIVILPTTLFFLLTLALVLLDPFCELGGASMFEIWPLAFVDS